MNPRRRHVAIAVGLLAAVSLEILLGFAQFWFVGDRKEHAWVVPATVFAVLATAGAGLLLFRMSVRQGRMEAEQLAAIEIERAKRLAEIGQLAAGIAHEIHNPLQGINGYIALLERDGVDAERRRAHLAAIRAALAKIERLTRDLLDFTNPAPPRRVLVAPYHIFQTMDRSLEADPRFVDIRRAIEIGASVRSAVADAAALERVLLNLSLNARDAMGGRGTLTFRARRGAPGFVEIEVADTGPGVAESVRPHLFEPFRSGRGSTGLGLWICDHIVRANRGRIRYEPGSAAGAGPAGARFIITLPADT